MSRAQTIVLALLIMRFRPGALSLAVARGGRAVPSLRTWVWGLFIYAFGLVLTMQRVAQVAVSLTLGNSLIAWASVITVKGVLAGFNGLPSPTGAFYAAKGAGRNRVTTS